MKNTRNFTLTAMFLSILILLSVVPFLGFIPIGPINATTMHIPVIIASIVLGPKRGAFLGGIFGLISMIRSTVIISPLSFVFSPFVPVIGTSQGDWKALLVAIIPRILLGFIPYFIYKGMNYLTKSNVQNVSLFVSGFLGSLVNTLLVMGFIYVLFKDSYATAMGINSSSVYTAILTIIFTSGIVEAFVAAIATVACTKILLHLSKNK